MDENTRFALVGIGSSMMIGAMAGVGSVVIKRAAAARYAESGRADGVTDEGFIGARAFAVLGVTVGLFVSMFGVYGPWSWPPAQMSQRLFLAPAIVGAIGLGGVILTAWRGRASAGGERGLGWIISATCAGVGAAIAMTVALGKPLWDGALAPHGAAVWVPLVFAAWSALGAWSIGRVVGGGARMSGSIVLLGLSLAVGAGMKGAFNQKLGDNGLGVAAVCAGLAAGALLLRGSIGPGSIGVICGMLGVIVGCGTLMADKPSWWIAIGLGLVAPTAWAADVLAARRMGKVAGSLVRIAPAAVVAIAAVAPGVWALIQFARGNG